MEKDSKVNSDTEQLTVIASVAVTVPSQTTTNDRGTSSHKANSIELSSTSEKNASEIYDSSDTTIQSDQENVAHKIAADENKSFLPDRTLQQLLKAHSERTTSAHVEVELNHGPAIVTNSSSPGSELLEVKNSNAPGPSSKISHTISPLNATISTTANQLHAENPETEVIAENEATSSASIRSISSLVCRICHNSENPERLVSPCFCKGSLTYVHIHCLERWISTSRSTTCELCQFQYNTEQTLRYTCFQSLRMWYSRSMSRRALQEDCQMFSLLTLVAFGIIGTLLVGIQYYFLQGRTWGLSRIWTKGWLIFFLFTTLAVYFINIYMIVRSQLAPWYRWWQSARDIKLILENRKPFHLRANKRNTGRQSIEQQSLSGILPTNSPMSQQQQQQTQNHQPEQNLMDHQSQFQPPQVKPTNANRTLPNIVIPLTSEHIQASNLSVRVLQSFKNSACKIPISTKRSNTIAVKTAPTIEVPFQGFVY